MLHFGSLRIDPPVLQAPMAGFTNYAFRQMIRGWAAWAFRRRKWSVPAALCIRAARGEELPERLWGVLDEPRPLAAQIWDNDPDTLAAVARRLVEEFRVSVVDINFGCPGPGHFARRPKAAPTCCAIPTAWAKLSPALSGAAGPRR